MLEHLSQVGDKWISMPQWFRLNGYLLCNIHM